MSPARALGVLLRTILEFEVELYQLHNDSTTLTLTGEYRDAQGREVRWQPTLVVPKLEKRHEQLKSVQDLAPMWLKNAARIGALLFRYFAPLQGLMRLPTSLFKASR